MDSFSERLRSLYESFSGLHGREERESAIDALAAALQQMVTDLEGGEGCGNPVDDTPFQEDVLTREATRLIQEQFGADWQTRHEVLTCNSLDCLQGRGFCYNEEEEREVQKRVNDDASDSLSFLCASSSNGCQLEEQAELPEHLFDSSRDSVDILTTKGASDELEMALNKRHSSSQEEFHSKRMRLDSRVESEGDEGDSCSGEGVTEGVGEGGSCSGEGVTEGVGEGGSCSGEGVTEGVGEGGSGGEGAVTGSLAVTAKSPLVCISCSFVAANRKQLWRHGKSSGHETRMAGRSSLRQCQQCHFRASTHFNLTRHIRRFHSTAHVECRECGRLFQEVSTLESHLLYHHHCVPRPFRCHECGVSLTAKNNLMRHFRSQHQA